MQVTPVSNLYAPPANSRRNAFNSGSGASHSSSFTIERGNDQTARDLTDRSGVAPLAYSPELFALTASANEPVSQSTGAAIYRNASLREAGQLTGRQLAESA